MRWRPALLMLAGMVSSAGCQPAGTTQQTPAEPICQASGARHLVPPITDAAACLRFMREIAAARGVQSVRLTIQPQGVLNARITPAGSQGAPGDYGLAVSDRPMKAQDIDLLAANVIADRLRSGT